MSYNTIERDVRAYVNELYVINDAHSLPFHNLARTKDVVGAAKKIASHYHLDNRSVYIIEVAAWFSQTGYVIDRLGNPVQKSVEIASEFLIQAQLPEQDIVAIADCIKVALGNSKPSVFLEEVISDAYNYYLGTSDFKALNKLHRKEYEMNAVTGGVSKDWLSLSIEMFESHEYFTDYCRSLLGPGKMDNLEKIKSKQQKKISGISAQFQDAGAFAKDQVNTYRINTEKAKIVGEKSPVRGIEMMFRVSSANNVRISVMADNKAHIMITVNSIIISVVLGLIVRNIESHRNLILPSIVLLTINVFTIIYSVLATRPAFSKGIFTDEQVERKSINMLFFGSFYNMGFSDYSNAMKKVMTDTEFLYACLLKDLYWQGKVLGRKYKLLRIAYTIFLFGIIVSVIAFSIAGIFFE
ncbi:hypothetical protein BH10BAC3_BH10BAC3_34820 [soil metagenome]